MRIRTLMGLLMGLGAGCGDEAVDHTATCVTLAAQIAAHLYLPEDLGGLGCEPRAEFAAEFAAACVDAEPSGEEAAACLDEVYLLEGCPSSIPDACLDFSGNVQVTPW